MSTFKCFEFHKLRAGPPGPRSGRRGSGVGRPLLDLSCRSIFSRRRCRSTISSPEKPIPICHPDFIDPLNWEGQGSFLCFPSASKSEMVDWLEMWEEHFTERFRNQKILRFFRMSVADKNCDPRCEDFDQVQINGRPVRQYSQADDVNPKGALQYMEVVSRHLKMASAGKRSDEKLSTEGFGAREEVEFLSTWLSKFVYCFPGKKSNVSNQAISKTSSRRVALVSSSLVGHVDAMIDLGSKGPSSPLESSYYGETILDQCCQRKDQWLMTSITGHLKHIVDFGRGVAVPLADPAGGLYRDRTKRIACKSIDPKTLDLLNHKA
ncbi:hypothetical protein MLD38_040918 [Melastoma candidum]|nr:hypothetical protein MLD38_040918 [Melastoma candidum]